MSLELRHAKRLAAGIKASLPSDQPVIVEAAVTLKSDEGDYLVLKIEGRPPFLRYTIATDTEVRNFVSHDLMH